MFEFMGERPTHFEYVSQAKSYADMERRQKCPDPLLQKFRETLSKVWDVKSQNRDRSAVDALRKILMRCATEGNDTLILNMANDLDKRWQQEVMDMDDLMRRESRGKDKN